MADDFCQKLKSEHKYLNYIQIYAFNVKKSVCMSFKSSVNKY